MTDNNNADATQPKAAATGSEAVNTQTGNSEVYQKQEINLETLMTAGAHYGHQVDRWNPRMLPYIFAKKNGVYILNLDKTMEQWARAKQAITTMAAQGGNILFVGTKQQAREIMGSEARRCGAFHITTRWLGGMLSNFQTIKNSIDRMRQFEHLLEQAGIPETKVKLAKKEKLSITRELQKLNESLGGIREMRKIPDMIFLVDLHKEDIAVAEARKLRIPLVALVDSNVDPSLVTYPITANDDATKTIKLFASAVADAVLAGRATYEQRRPKTYNAAQAKEAAAAAAAAAAADASQPAA